MIAKSFSQTVTALNTPKWPGNEGVTQVGTKVVKMLVFWLSC